MTVIKLNIIDNQQHKLVKCVSWILLVRKMQTAQIELGAEQVTGK